MNINDIKLLAEPSAENNRQLHEANKFYLRTCKDLIGEIKVFCGPKPVKGWAAAIEAQEAELNSYEAVLSMDDNLWDNASNELRQSYSVMYACSIKQAETVQASREAFERFKSEIQQLYKPPLLSELITRLVVSPRQADRVIDCRAETFVMNCAKHGSVRAYWFHWTDTVKSSWPAVKRLIPFAAAFDILRRWFGS